MKKIISCLLVLLMCVAVFSACGNTQPPVETDPPVVEEKVTVVNAKDYLYAMYKDNVGTTAENFERVGVISIGGTKFPVEWTADTEYVSFAKKDNGMVTVVIGEEIPEAISYKLTATVTDAEGATESISFEHKLNASATDMSVAEVLERAFALEEGKAMAGTQVLRGKIVKIDTPYDAKYGNVSVIINVGEKDILCYRLQGEGADALKVDDVITVSGVIKNYKGTIEFDAKCTFSKDMSVEEMKQLSVVEKAFALEEGKAMAGKQVLRGEIVKIDTAYDAKYGNVSVVIKVGEKDILCYRLQGEGADALKVGDVITVTGNIKNYKGTIEFDAKCTFTKGSIEESKYVILAEKAFELEEGKAMAGKQTLGGEIVKIDTPYDAKYGNVSVVIKVGEKDILCYRLQGEGADTLAVGDVITVTGIIKNYKGTIEFDAKCTFTK